jgi:hypothetical protein
LRVRRCHRARNAVISTASHKPIASALGHKQTSRPQFAMSALPQKADIGQHGGNVRFVAKSGHWHT